MTVIYESPDRGRTVRARLSGTNQVLWTRGPSHRTATVCVPEQHWDQFQQWCEHHHTRRIS